MEDFLPRPFGWLILLGGFVFVLIIAFFAVLLEGLTNRWKIIKPFYLVVKYLYYLIGVIFILMAIILL